MKVLLSISFLLISVALVGQDLFFGVKFGLLKSYMDTQVENNKNNMDIPGIGDKCSSVSNFQIGVFFNIKFDRKIGILIEPGYLHKGASFNYIAYPMQVESSEVLRLSYLDLPVIFYYQITRKNKIELGTEFGYLTYKNLSFDSEHIKYLNNKFDFALNIGISRDMNKIYNYGFRYSYSLTRLYYDENLKNIIYLSFVPITSPIINYYNRYFEVFIRVNLINN